MGDNPGRDVLTLGIPMFLACFLALGLGLLLNWSDGALGWAIIAAGAIVTIAWGLLAHRDESRLRR